MEALRLAQLYHDDGHRSSSASGTPSLDTYFDPTDFVSAAHIALDKLRSVLEPRQSGGVQLRHPADLVGEARALMTSRRGDIFNAERFSKIVDLYIETGIKLNSQGYMARQFSSVLPVSAVFDMVSAMSPQPASYYEAGQLANVADKIMAQEFGPLIGWPDDSFEMVTTSGATLANTTAVLTARNKRLSTSWNEGVSPDTQRGRPAIAIGEDAHFSVSRIAGIIGVGQDQVVRLPLNEKRQICMVGATRVMEDAAAHGLDVFCLIGSAGTTSVGANDPLVELAGLAKRYNAWFHVDAAHNGAFLVSDSLRPRLRGIELADSFCIDAHKTLFVPALCTLLFYREKGVAEAAFPQKASYVFDPFEDEMSNFQSGIRNFECTKRPAIMNLWLAWALYGRSVFEQKLDHLVSLTETAHSYLDGLSDFEMHHHPESNILCFTHHPPGLERSALSDLQLQLRNRVRTAGNRFISKVELEGNTVLRIVLMNHHITLSDITDLVEEIRAHARDIMAEPSVATVSPESNVSLSLNVG